MRLAVKQLGTLNIGQRLEFPGGLVAVISATFNTLDDTHTVAGHTGCDVFFPVGTTVPSAVSGTVVLRSVIGDAWSVVFGNSVIIDHGDGTLSLWAHFRDAPLVNVGARVEVGTPLGVQGNTGMSSGDHVHIGWTTSANPAFQRDANGGCSRLLNAFDYIDAAEQADAVAAAVMVELKPDTRAIVEHATYALDQWSAHLRELVNVGAPDFAVRTAAQNAQTAVDAILEGVAA